MCKKPDLLFAHPAKEIQDLTRMLNSAAALRLVDKHHFIKDLMETLRYKDAFHEELEDFIVDAVYSSLTTLGHNTSLSLDETVAPYARALAKAVHASLQANDCYEQGIFSYELYRFSPHSLLFRRL